MSYGPTAHMRSRKRGRVGASDACTVVESEHAHKSELELYDAVTTGQEPATIDGESALIGHMTEPVTIRALEHRLRLPLNHYRRTWTRGHMAASPDGGNKAAGVLVEAKARAWIPDEPVRAHYWQCCAQLAVISWAREVYLAYLTGSRLTVFTIRRVDVLGDIDRLELAVDSFYALYVRPGVPPVPDLDRDEPGLILRFPALPEGVVEAQGALLDLGNEYASARTVTKAAQAEENPSALPWPPRLPGPAPPRRSPPDGSRASPPPRTSDERSRSACMEKPDDGLP